MAELSRILRAARRFAPLAIALPFCLLVPERAQAAQTPKPAEIPTVGMEGRIEIQLPGTLLDAKPVEDRSKVILRIADTRPHGTLIHYDLRYVAMVPGTHDLKDYLVRRDGSTTADLPRIEVHAIGLLPENHDGLLLEAPDSPWRWFGGYKNAMTLLVILWFLSFTVILVVTRRKHPRISAAPPAAKLSLADRLQPLLEQATQGKLDADSKAELERLLLLYWRDRAGLGAVSAQAALAELKSHPEAGPLLRAIEDWLHKPPGTAQVDIPALLARKFHDESSN